MAKYYNCEIFILRSVHSNLVYIGYTTNTTINDILKNLKYIYDNDQLKSVKLEVIFDLGNVQITSINKNIYKDLNEIHNKLKEIKAIYKPYCINPNNDIEDQQQHQLHQQQQQQHQQQQQQQQQHQRQQEINKDSVNYRLQLDEIIRSNIEADKKQKPKTKEKKHKKKKKKKQHEQHEQREADKQELEHKPDIHEQQEADKQEADKQELEQEQQASASSQSSGATKRRSSLDKQEREHKPDIHEQQEQQQDMFFCQTCKINMKIKSKLRHIRSSRHKKKMFLNQN